MLMVIISSYPASLRRITVLVNFQAILLIFSGETYTNRHIFFTEDAAKKSFPTSKISAQEFAINFSLLDYYWIVRPRGIAAHARLMNAIALSLSAQRSLISSYYLRTRLPS